MITQILCAIDDTEPSRNVADFAIGLARQLSAGLVICETHRTTSIAYTVVTCADLHRADLIVVGASGRNRIIGLLRRAVSRAVADIASCPVIIIRHARAQFPSAAVK